MAWIDGKLGWLEPYFNGPKYKKESEDLYLAVSEQNRQLNSMNLKLKTQSALLEKKDKEIVALSIKTKEVLPSVYNADYWNTKFPTAIIKYPDVEVTTHLKFREIKGVADLAIEILDEYKPKTADDVANAWNKWCVKNIETQTRRAASTTKRFKYFSEVKEIWRTPEQTLKLEYGDCDDFMILGYFVIRKMLMLLNLWIKNSHRLLCQVVFVFSLSNRLPKPSGWHANMLWIHSDLNYYTLETTYYANKAVSNFGNKPQKINPMYQLIDFTFHSDSAFSLHNLEMSSREYKKKYE